MSVILLSQFFCNIYAYISILNLHTYITYDFFYLFQFGPDVIFYNHLQMVIR